MSDPDTNTILKALHDHREETRQDMHRLHDAVVKIADAAADMGKTMARSEERHSNHEHTVKRMSKSIDDHEQRLRFVEVDHPQQIESIRTMQKTGRSSVDGGWKVLTVIGSVALGLIALGSLVIKATQ